MALVAEESLPMAIPLNKAARSATEERGRSWFRPFPAPIRTFEELRSLAVKSTGSIRRFLWPTDCRVGDNVLTVTPNIVVVVADEVVSCERRIRSVIAPAGSESARFVVVRRPVVSFF